MPSRPARPSRPRHLVTAVLVTHDGERWLPETLSGLRRQTREPQRTVAVDTGSIDGTVALLTDALGESAVLSRGRQLGFGAAVQVGLDAFIGAPWPVGIGVDPVEWVWLLHDDCVPDPGALEAMLALADDMPSAAVIGPKCLGWDGRHLAEIGVTTDITGRRETGLERREVDQGQHDGVRDVLAVGSAGALVRRDVWDRLGGFDRSLGLFGDDVDFGWRANLAGERVVVAPQAVVRHVGAASAGLRAADAVGGRPRRAARRHGLQVVLTNISAATVAVAVPRIVIGALLRALGLLLARRPGAAYDELAAAAAVLAHPFALRRARGARRPLRRRRAREVHHLLAHPSVRMRHYAEAVAEAVRGGDRDPHRRRRAVETGPVAEEAENFETGGQGLLRRVAGSPGVLLVGALALLAIVTGHQLVGSGLQGGRLLPASGGASDLWQAYLTSWHATGLGSGVSAPPYLALLATAATVLLGKPWLLLDVLLIGAVPLAAATAYRASRVVTTSVALRVWASLGYALLAPVAAAAAGGRLDAVVAAILLPPLAVRVGRVVATDPRDSGWHRPVAAGLLLAIASAFAPGLYVVAAACAVLGCVAVAVWVPRLGAGVVRRRIAAVAAVLAVPPAVLAPWTMHVVRNPVLLASGVGAADPFRAARPVPAHDLLLLHAGGPASLAAVLGIPLLLTALVGLSRRDRRAQARTGALVAVAGLVSAVVVSRLDGPVAGSAASRYWAGVPVLVIALGLLTSALVAGDGARKRLERRAFGWRQPAAALLALLALVAPAVAGVQWLVRGAGDPLRTAPSTVLPAFVGSEINGPTQGRALLLRTAPDGTVLWSLSRDAGPRLGDADVVATDEPTEAARRLLAETVRDLTSASADVSGPLTALGVRFVVLPAPGGAAKLAGALDRNSALVAAESTTGEVWRVAAKSGRLTVLPPAAAAAARSGKVPDGADRGDAVLPGGERTSVAHVAAGPSGRLLVLSEPANGHWHARLGGHELVARTAYGWAQAFELPPASGRVVVTRDSGGRPLALWLELAALLAALLLATPPMRRRDELPFPVVGPQATAPDEAPARAKVGTFR